MLSNMSREQNLSVNKDMSDPYRKILQASEISDNDKYYWGYQFRLAADVLVPYLQRYGAFRSGYKVAEIGCAEGGVLAAFELSGAQSTLGTDIAVSRLETGRAINRLLGVKALLTEHDVIYEEPKPEWLHTYDLVILRDVIEHLDDTEISLKNIARLLKPNGCLFVTFPPYHSPFGGHQHLIKNKWGKIPFIHLLPRKIFFELIANGKTIDVEEVRRLRDISLTTKKFMKAAENAGYGLYHEEYYLLRPVFKMKFGLPTISLTPLKSLPLVQRIFSMEAAYILRWQRK